MAKFSSVVDIYYPRDAMIHHKEYKSILHLWERFQAFNATNPRDMIFALLGLADKHSIAIKVDYSASVKELYTIATRSIITQTGNLDALCYNYVSSDWYPMHPWLPSWAIDFSARAYRYLERESVKNTASQAKPCSIVGGVASDTTSATLALHGVRLGRIVDEFHIDPQNLSDNLGERLRTFVQELPDWIFASPKNGAQRNVDRFARALLGQLPLDEFIPPPPSDAVLIKELGDFLLFMRSWKSRFIYVRYNRIRPYDESSYLQQTLKFMTARIGLDKFCLDGPLMARVPKHARKDDVLCVLWGSKVPHVLRPVSGVVETYQLIGTACVEGYMTGKAATDSESGILSEEIFTLV